MNYKSEIIMKRNILYLTGIALYAIGLLSACDEDIPSYTNLTVDTETLTIDLDEATEGSFSIIEGNGGYKVTSSNTAVAIATVSGNEVIVTGLEYGTATLTLTDWARKSANIKVVVDQEQDLVVKTSSTTMLFGESKILEIYTGNEGYSITSSDESVATAKVSEDGKIEITSIKPGTTILTVKDRRNKTAEISVKVIRQLVIDLPDPINYIIVGEPVIIKILDGNGEYTCTTDGSKTYISCEMSKDGTEVNIEGLKKTRLNKTVTIKDKEGQTIKIPVMYIDDTYLGSPSYRYLVKGYSSYQSFSTTSVKNGTVTYSPEFRMSQLMAASTGSYSSGYAIQFNGDLNKGEKNDAVVYRYYKGEIETKTPYPVEDCRIDQVEDGWYWISFQEPDCPIRSYIVTKQTE